MTKHRTVLGHSNIDISTLCLGTMTWGGQNTQNDAFEQMNYALEQDVNFWDTAEIYAVPPSAETYGSTETMIGNWFKETGKRDQIILTSKIAGRTPHPKPVGSPRHHHDSGMQWLRDGNPRHDRKNIMIAIEDSLTRLQTDYVDLYQLHWPDRPSQRFGIRDFFVVEDDMNPSAQYDDMMLEILRVMDDLIKAGKIRSWGLSNETAWGVMKYSWLAEKNNLPKPTSVQNPYNLLDRRDEFSMSEVCLRENIAYLPYSPLAAGVLSGKYLNGHWPENARFTNYGRKGRYIKPKCEEATAEYVEIALTRHLDPAAMALAFVNQQPFVTSNIIGATKMADLKANIASRELVLSDKMIAEINAVHELNPNPGP